MCDPRYGPNLPFKQMPPGLLPARSYLAAPMRSVRGLGLGLAITRQLVELHGGSIRAESPGTGQGSTFTVAFPRSPVTAAPSNGRVYSQADQGLGLEDAPDVTGIRVLVVEDDDDARALLAKVLQGRGAFVQVVSPAREALDVLSKPVQPAELITVVASLATRRN